MNVYRHVQATTASDLTADQWRSAWMLAAPVVVAANRFVEASADGTPGLIEDAHFQLLRALVDYKEVFANAERDESDKAVARVEGTVPSEWYLDMKQRAEQAEQQTAFVTDTLTATVNLANERMDELKGLFAAFPLVPDVPGYSGPRPVWADWYDRVQQAIKR